MLMCMSFFPVKAVNSKTILLTFLNPGPSRVVLIYNKCLIYVKLIKFMFNFLKTKCSLELMKLDV